jgi:hypothetical protein
VAYILRLGKKKQTTGNCLIKRNKRTEIRYKHYKKEEVHFNKPMKLKNYLPG